MLSISYVKAMTGDDIVSLNTYTPPQICIKFRKHVGATYPEDDWSTYFENLSPCEAACFLTTYENLDLMRQNYQLIIGRWWIDWVTMDRYLMEDIIIDAFCEQHEYNDGVR